MYLGMMHQLCSQAGLTVFRGTRVEHTFGRCLCRRWVWEKELRMSRHDRTGSTLPPELLIAEGLVFIADSWEGPATFGEAPRVQK